MLWCYTQHQLHPTSYTLNPKPYTPNRDGLTTGHNYFLSWVFYMLDILARTLRYGTSPFALTLHLKTLTLYLHPTPHTGTTGHMLDILARTPLWQAGLDYKHGTGHGVGAFLCENLRVLQCVAVRCSVLQCLALCCSVLQCVAAYCSVLQRVAVFCSVM